METESVEDVRRRVEKRYKSRQELIIHLAAFVVFNVLLWIMFPHFWMLWVTGGWMVGLIGHGIYYYTEFGQGANRQRDAIQREVERELAGRPLVEKPKNDNRIRLTDDGELEEVPEDEIRLVEKRQYDD